MQKVLESRNDARKDTHTPIAASNRALPEFAKLFVDLERPFYAYSWWTSMYVHVNQQQGFSRGTVWVNVAVLGRGNRAHRSVG